MAVRTGTILNIEELDSKEIVEKVTRYIVRNKRQALQSDNLLFYAALKKAGLDAYEILRTATKNLVETTVKKGEEHIPITEEVFLYLSSWREYVDDEANIEAKVAQRLAVLKGMLEGKYWVSQLGQNLVVITDGHIRLTISKGSIH